ncbi:hypothetical protein HYX04_00545 [Candidatus Woesearchaeota archaeon]|nr:hypothetical protein [Candidatus Woesearchaeota archaeon]
MLLARASFAQQPSCDYKVEILVDAEEFEKDDFKWRMRATKIEGKSTNITGIAEIEDSSGKTAKNYKPWTSQSISKQKTSSEYTPNLKPGEYKITAEINVECDDTNKGNNADTKEIKIKGATQEAINKKAKTEDAEEAVNTLASNVEKEQITLKTAKTAAKPADEETENTIQLANKNTQKIQQQPMTANTAQAPEIAYESSNDKAKGLIMVFLLTLSILLNIILIWKR